MPSSSNKVMLENVIVHKQLSLFVHMYIHVHVYYVCIVYVVGLQKL